MYRLIPCIGSVVVLLTMTTAASGTNYVWLEAAPLTDGAIVIEDGQGHAVSLECDPAMQDGAAECRWMITVRIGNDDPMFAWSLDLGSSDDFTSALSVGYLEPIFGPGGGLVEYYPFDGPLTPTLGSGQTLMRQLGAGTISAVPAATNADDGIAWSVAQFVLSKVVTDSDSGFVEIFGRTGVAGYGPEPGQTFPGQVGDNDAMDIEQPLTIYPNALITITSPQGDDYTPPGDGGGGFLWGDEEIDPPLPDDNGNDNTPDNTNNTPADSPVPGNPPNGNTNDDNTNDNATDDSSGFIDLGLGGGGPGGIPSIEIPTGGTVGGIAVSQGGSHGNNDPFAALTGLCGPSGLMSTATALLMMIGATRQRRSRL
ncbi:MAG: hypothetical protein H6818_02195 [Phycisphaerales bacterium]|nr:hypothetical protein [Phycisphaerales bacterium]MCB9863124.1 hypothetical protein [Phycisphaerales bacterium]